MNLEEKRISTETIYDGKIIRVERDIALLPDESEAVREVVRHPGGVGVVAVDHEGFVYMVRQYRYPFGKITLEIPAVKLDAKGEDPEKAGIRELKEETGFTAENFEFLGSFFATPGFCDEQIRIFLATNLTAGETDPDDDEFLECEKYKMDDLIKMIESGKIRDMKSVTGILLAKNKLDKSCSL